MIEVYCVQSFYGTNEKYFKCKYNAIDYYNKLVAIYEDADLIEIYKLVVNRKDFIYLLIDD